MKTRSTQALLFAVRVLTATLACVGISTASPPPPSASAEAFADAQDLYSQCKWSAAYRRFAELADAGNAQAADIVLLMHRYGRRLYGHEWGASQSQIDRWTELSLQRTKVARVDAAE